MTDTANDYNTALLHRAATLDTLIQLAENVLGDGDQLDMLGRIRLVELAADQARRATIAEARLAGVTWEQIGDALGTSRQNAQQRFGNAGSAAVEIGRKAEAAEADG